VSTYAVVVTGEDATMAMVHFGVTILGALVFKPNGNWASLDLITGT